MRILFVSQHYWPEPMDNAQVAEGLARRGHEVVALVGQPNYPEGTIYPGYEGTSVTEGDERGVHVVRCPLHPRKTGVVNRVWNYYSYPRSATRAARTLGRDFDVVLAYQTSPVMMARPALAYARETGTPVLLYCLDIWPECLTAGGIAKGSLVYNVYRRAARDIYGAADRLAISSPLFEAYFTDVVGISPKDPVLLPHFAVAEFGFGDPGPCDAVDPTKFNVTFAGNVGAAQSVQTLVRAAAILAGDERMAFHVLGSGTELEACRDLAASLGATNVTFHGRLPQDQMPSWFAASDALAITFARNDLLAFTMPRKMFDYMASSRPLVGAADGEVARVIMESGCGLCAPALDAEGLARACAELADRDDLAQMGAAGRRYYMDNYSMGHFFDTLEEALESLKGRRHGA